MQSQENQLILDLYDKFSKLYEQMKDTQEQLFLNQEENKQLQTMIDDEIYQHEQSIDKFQEQILQSQKQKLELDNKIQSSNEKLKQNTQIVYELKDKLSKSQKQFIDLQKILNEQDKELSYNNKTNQQFQQAYDEIQCEIQKSTQNTNQMSAKINIINTKIVQIKNQIHKLSEDFHNNQNALHSEIGYKFVHDQLSQENNVQFRKNQNLITELNKLHAINTKELDKSSEILKQKITRLESQLQLNHQLCQQYKKFELEKDLILQLKGENLMLQQQIDKFELELEVFYLKVPNNQYKIEIKKFIQNQLKTQNIDEILQNLNEKFYDDQENIQIFENNTDSTSNLQQMISEKDHQIFTNKLKIKTIEQLIIDEQEKINQSKSSTEIQANKLQQLIELINQKYNFPDENYQDIQIITVPKPYVQDQNIYFQSTKDIQSNLLNQILFSNNN